MKSIPVILLSLFFIACSKKNSHDNIIPPLTTDSLATGWREVTLPPSQGGTDIFFFNNTTGFVVGGYFISRSNDGGNTWQNVYRSNDYISNIAMGSAVNAIFVTYSGVVNAPAKLIITFDGGNTFDSVNVADEITDAFFVSASVAYAIGKKCWKTINGGRNWTSIYDFGPAAVSYRSFHFLNEQTGWWAGHGGVFKTGNAGINWDSQPVSVFNFANFGNVYFADANTGYISDNNSVGKSINGGTTWTKIFTLQNEIYHDLHFLTPAIGYVTDYQYIYKTTDGGNTWTRQAHLINNAHISEVHFTDADHGWASGSEGFILKYEK